MNDISLTILNSIDILIENGDLNEAVDTLKRLAEEYPNEGVVAYYLGRVCLIYKNEKLALKFFLTAIERGYTTADVYLSTALLQKNLFAFNEAERLLIKATEVADTEDINWASLSCLAVFYIENEMYLKAEKIAKKLIKEFPDNYQGYHLHIIIEVMREHFDEVSAYINMLPEKFKNHPQHLIDVIEIYKKSNKGAELSDVLESDPRFATIIPQFVLREKIVTTPNDKYDTKEKLVRQLAKDYYDKDAIVSVMILEFSRKNFEKSAKIANVILDNEKSIQGSRYYIALYFQIYNLYFLSEKKPSAELQKWIEKAGNWCINYADEMGIPAASDIVASSIQELFDEINCNSGAHE